MVHNMNTPVRQPASTTAIKIVDIQANIECRVHGCSVKGAATPRSHHERFEEATLQLSSAVRREIVPECRRRHKSIDACESEADAKEAFNEQRVINSYYVDSGVLTRTMNNFTRSVKSDDRTYLESIRYKIDTGRDTTVIHWLDNHCKFCDTILAEPDLRSCDTKTLSAFSIISTVTDRITCGCGGCDGRICLSSHIHDTHHHHQNWKHQRHLPGRCLLPPNIPATTRNGYRRPALFKAHHFRLDVEVWVGSLTVGRLANGPCEHKVGGTCRAACVEQNWNAQEKKSPTHTYIAIIITTYVNKQYILLRV